jgi:predicted nuclease of predicted toxin-antitoxin system
MKFIVDAQLPSRIATWLRGNGHDAIHTLELPEANRTTDAAIAELAAREQRIVITKDADFVDTHLLQGRPEKLLLISTGNITNHELGAILIPNIPAIVEALRSSRFVELSRTGIVVHG